MKKLALSLMLLLCTVAGMAQEFTEVASFEELKAAIDSAKYDGGMKSNAKIKLTADICLDGMMSTLVNTFTGEIDGDYQVLNPKTGKYEHANRVIYGGKQAFEKGNKEEKLCSKLFENVEDAKFKNLFFYKIRIQDDSYDHLGLIARNAKNTEFGNIVTDSISVFCDKNYAGTLVGRAEDCKFAGISINYCDITVDGKGAGGMVGYSKNSTYYVCITNMASSVFADGNNWTNDGISGGVVGDSYNDNFYSCLNYAMVGADQCCLGGMTGQSEYSNFDHCVNGGAVFHCDSDDFKKACAKQRAQFVGVTMNQVAAVAAGVVGTALIGGITYASIANISAVAYWVTAATLEWYGASITGLTSFLFDSFHTFSISVLYGTATTAAKASIAGTAIGLWPVTAVVAVLAGAVITYEIMIGDDEVGGITGQARGGVFEGCTNTGFLGCKDDNLGGIVGLGYGVTVNNCQNTAWFAADEDDTSGSIIGKVDLDDKNNGKKCKITNCLSTARRKIVGDYHTEWSGGRIDPASGNNYVLDSKAFTDESDKPSDWEMRVTTQQLISGMVAIWLNNGNENRKEGIRPWHQNLAHITGYQGNAWDSHPVLDATHNEVNAKDLKAEFRIATPQDLIDFSASVNDGNQFAVAVLTADIDMSGMDWTPVGKDEAGKHFRGVFDGQGHTIRGLKCSSDKAVGLFGAVHAGAYICNVTLADDCELTTTGNLGAGGIVGVADINWKWGNVVIENCTNYGKVNGKNNAGGIFGRAMGNMGDNVKIHVSNCFSMGTVTAQEGNSGMIGGYMRTNGVVSNCWSYGKLVSNSWAKPYDEKNGDKEFFAGHDGKLDINNCYAIATADNVQGADLFTCQNGVRNFLAEDLTNGVIEDLLNENGNPAEPIRNLVQSEDANEDNDVNKDKDDDERMAGDINPAQNGNTYTITGSIKIGNRHCRVVIKAGKKILGK